MLLGNRPGPFRVYVKQVRTALRKKEGEEKEGVCVGERRRIRDRSDDMVI
jgi:hypothetical protein